MPAFESVVAEDELGDAVPERGVGFVRATLGLACSVEEED